MFSRKTLFSALAALFTTAALVPAGPASAVSVQTFENAGLRDGYRIACCHPGTSGKAWLAQSDNVRFYVHNTTPVNGHSVVHLQSVEEPGCLDSHGNSAGDPVWWQPCNDGDYQLWEVFKVSDSGGSYVVFKSRGAYTRQGKHLCMAGKKVDFMGINEALVLKTCNTNDVWQRFF